MSAAVQAPNFESEHFDCLDCGELITNPICPECIFKAFQDWIVQYPKLAKKVLSKVKKFLKGHRHLSEESQLCVICKKKRAWSCPYCFTEHIYDLLKEARASSDVLREYLMFFSFDFGDFSGKWGYWKEGERLGIY